MHMSKWTTKKKTGHIKQHNEYQPNVSQPSIHPSIVMRTVVNPLRIPFFVRTTFA